MTVWWDMAREFASPFTFMLVGLFVAAAIVYVSRRRRSGQSLHPPNAVYPPTSRPFARGFDLLIDNHWQEAIAVLKEAVGADPHRILEYLELAKLFRRRDEPRRAARLFEHVLARPGLQRDERVMALYELGLSYRAMGVPEDAVAMLEGVLRTAPQHRTARCELRRTYEEMGRWDKAVAVERVRLKRGEAADAQTLAALRTQQGKVVWASGNMRAGAAHLRAALALDPQCTEAALVLGRLLLRQGRARRALRLWDGLGQHRPEFLYLAFRDMQAAYRQLSKEAEWEGYLQRFTACHSDDPTGQLALAEWYEVHGRPHDALTSLRRALALDPLCREAHLALLTLCRGQGMPSEVLEPYERLTQGATWLSCGRFRCGACGHTNDEPFWKCPSCAIWATPQRLMPQPPSVPTASGEAPPALDDADPAVAGPIVVVRQAASQPPSDA
jgi:lipopolysaccharide biosynthesis regulator YciM